MDGDALAAVLALRDRLDARIAAAERAVRSARFDRIAGRVDMPEQPRRQGRLVAVQKLERYGLAERDIVGAITSPMPPRPIRPTIR